MPAARNRPTRAAAKKVVSYTVLSSSDDEITELEPPSKKRVTRQSARLNSKKKAKEESDEDDFVITKEDLKILSEDEDDDFIVLSELVKKDDDKIQEISSDVENLGGGFLEEDKKKKPAKKAAAKKTRRKGAAKKEMEEYDDEQKTKKPKKPRKQIDYHLRTTTKLFEHHPELIHIFDDLNNKPKPTPTQAPQPKLMPTELLPFQLEGLHWMKSRTCGILADEMGLGKTIQSIALIISDQDDVEDPFGITDEERKTTLVVAPTVALMQWKDEIEKHTANHLRTFLFYGPQRNKIADNLTNDELHTVFNKYDVVLTTYAVLESCYRREKYGVQRKKGKYYEKSLLHGTESFLMKLTTSRIETVTHPSLLLHWIHMRDGALLVLPFKTELVNCIH